MKNRKKTKSLDEHPDIKLCPHIISKMELELGELGLWCMDLEKNYYCAQDGNRLSKPCVLDYAKGCTKYQQLTFDFEG